MSRTVVILSLALFLNGAPKPANANEQGAAAGAITGAVAGAALGGPVGAVVGAVVGGLAMGAATGPGNQATDVQGTYAPTGTRNLAPRRINDPETTGSVVSERTCVRGPQGEVRCRRIR